MELVKSIVIAEKLLNLLPRYSIFEEKLIYSKKWNKTAEVQLDWKLEDNDL